MDKSSVKSRIREVVDQRREELVELSLRIHGNPELSFEEKKAAAWLSGYLEKNGFAVERGTAGLATAFKGTYGKGKPAIGIIAEYDALPKLGHACGHNCIAAAAMGAAVAGKLAVDAFGGSVACLGTPAEEGAGGKILMIERGAFEGLDVAMMIHPGRRNTALAEALAAIGLRIEFFGKASHAAADPEVGINALEAMILGFNAVNSLRQHIKERCRIHGIITNGGAAPNIVPDYTSAAFIVRAPDNEYLEEVKRRVIECFKGAAAATGAQLKYTWAERTYGSMKNSLTMAQLFSANLEALGRTVEPLDRRYGLGSTDMGNVSQALPSIHASLAIAPPEVSEHSEAFAQLAGSESGHQAVIDGAKAMAMTVADFLADTDLVARASREFHNQNG